jgi:hypothetical protein
MSDSPRVGAGDPLAATVKLAAVSTLKAESLALVIVEA